MFNIEPWQHPSVPAPLFTAEVNGELVDALHLEHIHTADQPSQPGVRHLCSLYRGPGFEVEWHLLRYEAHNLLEAYPILRCSGAGACHVSRLDSFTLPIPPAQYNLRYFASGWGNEFDPRLQSLAGPLELQGSAGRSSRLYHPWFALEAEEMGVLAGSIAWSGNWIFRFTPLPEGGYRISGGLLDEGFSKRLQPGETLEAPRMVLANGADLNSVAQQFTAVGRAHWFPLNDLSQQMPVEWNHWWSYEDTYLNEQIFAANLQAAPELEVEVCTLDAGWFGPSTLDTFWVDYRGDWDLVNEKRFPHGIRPLADQAHNLGMRFGIWCEIEALGTQAALARKHPEFVATRRGESLGYVCFGSPAVQEWAYQTLAHLIEDFKVDWIKLDFNLDPWLGCNRADHGHQAGDGLYEHYQGYYRTLLRLRTAYPQVFLENCSSGGLRIDLGLQRQTHATFLSDPDYPVNALQTFWGASLMLPPERILNWSFSEWCMEKPIPPQTFNPRDPQLTREQLDYYTRIGMLSMYGLSQKLPDLPAWVAKRLKEHHRIYRQIVRRFVSQSVLHRLTGQPQRSGLGDRLCAFQYSLPGTDEHLLFVFRLPGETTNHLIQLQQLEPNQVYMVEGLEGEFHATFTGAELMAGSLTFDHLAAEESVLLKVSPRESGGRIPR